LFARGAAPTPGPAHVLRRTGRGDCGRFRSASATSCVQSCDPPPASAAGCGHPANARIVLCPCARTRFPRRAWTTSGPARGFRIRERGWYPDCAALGSRLLQWTVSMASCPPIPGPYRPCGL